MHKQTVVSIQDLRFVTILCRRCNTKVTLDLDTEFAKPRSGRFMVPRECPRCQDPFDSVLPPSIEDLQRVYKSLAVVPGAVTFTSEAGPEEAEKG